jgi:hypothetical protein
LRDRWTVQKTVRMMFAWTTRMRLRLRRLREHKIVGAFN